MILYSWNICRSAEAWRVLAKTDADVALLQEATPPPPDVLVELEVDDAPWATAGAGLRRPWRTAIARVSERATTKFRPCRSLAAAEMGQLVVSREGTLSVADVSVADGAPITVASMYSAWEKPAAETGSAWIVSDASAHRLISDLSLLVGQQRNHRIIAAGDLNLLYGHGENGSAYWAARYQTVFDRFAAIGLRFVGPQSPNGAQANPWPKELPLGSKNVPTFRTRRTDSASATRQLDFVFASERIADRVSVKALNSEAEWGPSDHCALRIEVKPAVVAGA